MITWRLDRLRSAGAVCALATLALPALVGLLIAARSEVENILGGLLVASCLIAIGTVGGSMLISGLGAIMFGAVAAAAEVGTIDLLAVGICLFVTLMLHDLANALRRDPSIHRSVWLIPAKSATVVAVTASALFAIAQLISTATTWQVLLFPFGVAAIGFAARFAADAHARTVRQR